MENGYRSSVMTCNVPKPLDPVTMFLHDSRRHLDMLGTIERLDLQLSRSEAQEAWYLKALAKLQRENKKLIKGETDAESIRTGD